MRNKGGTTLACLMVVAAAVEPRVANAEPSSEEDPPESPSLWAEQDCPAAVASRDAVVMIRDNDLVGTGFLFLDARTVVTAAHVAMHGSARTALDREGRTYQLTLVAMDREHDVAVLEADRAIENGTPLQPARTVAVGMRVFAIGHPGATDAMNRRYPGLLRWLFTQGVVAAIGEDFGSVQTDSTIGGGSSGGPVVACSGALVSMIAGGLGPSNPPRLPVGSHVHWITRLARTRKDIPPRPTPPHVVFEFDLGLTSGTDEVLGGELATSLSKGHWGARLALAATSSAFTGDPTARVHRTRLALEFVGSWTLGRFLLVKHGAGFGWIHTATDKLFVDNSLGGTPLLASSSDHTDTFPAVLSLGINLMGATVSVALDIPMESNPRPLVWSTLGYAWSTLLN